MNTTTPGNIGGMNVAMAWPNMWLSGSRFRKRIGENGPAYLRYFRTSPCTGTILARMLRCVMMTPLGSAVAPDVKIISAIWPAAIAGEVSVSGLGSFRLENVHTFGESGSVT